MKMITSKSLSLSGGHIVSEQLLMPSYSPNAMTTTSSAQHFPWDEDVSEINTPDIDPSFFESNPFTLKMKTGIDPFESVDENIFATNQTMITSEESSQQSMQTYEDMSLCQLLSQTNVDINGMVKDSEVVMDNQYVMEPVLHYMEPKSVDAIALEVMATNSQIMTSEAEPIVFGSPTHSSSQSYSPSLSTINYSHLSSPSPALSYTSASTSSPSSMLTMDAMTSDTTATIDGYVVESIDQKPDLDFLQPTVINDHLYSSSSGSGTKRRRKSSADGKDKYSAGRRKNNSTSKKSRVTKRDKQKLMDEQIQSYIEDNENCRKSIELMERQIEWCKNYLFKKVVASARS